MNTLIHGPQLFETHPNGRLKTGIATLFLSRRVLFTEPGTHATQRAQFRQKIDEQRAEQLLPPLPEDEFQRICRASVDLYLKPGVILIRSVPGQMELALAADEQLQGLVGKQHILFLHANEPFVAETLRRRGELWRISEPPLRPVAMVQFIREAKGSIRLRPVYYHNHLTGTRYLSFQEFDGLSTLPTAELADQLMEARDAARSMNRFGNPDVACFPPGVSCQARAIPPGDLHLLSEEALRGLHAELVERFRAQVPVTLQRDDPLLPTWREAMMRALAFEPDKVVVDDLVGELGREFYRQIRWLPGARFEDGELILDDLLIQRQRHPDSQELREVCDPMVSGFIFNFIREFGDLEYVNVGRVIESLSSNPAETGRRGVYVAQIKTCSHARPFIRFLRLQRWGIREHLNERDRNGEFKSLEQAILEAHDYTNYVLDRRLACRQLGMNIPQRVSMWHVAERYDGLQERYQGRDIWATYFERDYVGGQAIDKLITAETGGETNKLRQDDYAFRLALLLGEAAAANIIIGRACERSREAVFCKGDEVIIEEQGLPVSIVVCDHGGSFVNFQSPLVTFAKAYADSVNLLQAQCREPRKFAQTFLEAFERRFRRLQSDFRERQRAFDRLFRSSRYDVNGSLAFRWEQVLLRLDATDAAELTAALRSGINNC